MDQEFEFVSAGLAYRSMHAMSLHHINMIDYIYINNNNKDIQFYIRIIWYILLATTRMVFLYEPIYYTSRVRVTVLH